MEDEPVAVELLAHAEEVARVVTRYGLVSIPVVDEGQRLMGVITASDALWDALPEEWRHETPRRIRAGSIAELAAKSPLKPSTKAGSSATATKSKSKPRAKGKSTTRRRTDG
jgi:CBS-domain-containing membrane protein